MPVVAHPTFADTLPRHGAGVAIVTDRASIDYAELDERVGEVAARLGAERRLVLVTAENTLESVVGYLGALRGHHAVLLAPAGDPEATAALVTAYRPDSVVAAGEVHVRHREAAHDLHPDLALLLSTSGSTGTPKLVRLSHEGLAANARSIATYLDLSRDDRAITTLPLHYCYGLSVLNSHLTVGASVVLETRSVVEPGFWDRLDATGATSFAGVPHTFELLDRTDFASRTTPSLRYVTQAGGRMDPATVRRYAQLGRRQGWELFVMYGQTEATARMAYLPPHLAETHPQAVGVPVPGGALDIDEPDDDGVGELVYRGPNVMLGYAHTPGDLGQGRTVSELRTGDLARVSGDGLIEIVGRRSRVVKPFGVRVDLDDLERLLGEAGVGAYCTGDDDTIVVSVADGTHADTARETVIRRLHVPAHRIRMLVTPEVPRLATGKVDYAALRAAARALDEPRPTGAVHSEPTAGTNGAVRAAFAEVLGVEPTGSDTFVSLGGDSLSYVEMSIRLEQVLGSLPRDWHLRRIDELDTTPAERRRFRSSVETTIVVRAVSIVLIVGTHADLWHLPGGAHSLLAIAGFNFARFRRDGRAAAASIARVAVPSIVWIGIVAAVSDKYGWPQALLVNGLVGGPDARWGYWFIEALVHTLVPLTILLAIPAVGRLERRRPFAIAAVAVGAGLVVRFDVVDLTTDYRLCRPQELFWLFGLGWAAARASGWPSRLLVSGVAVWSVWGFFDEPGRDAVVIASILAVNWIPTIPLPRVLTPAVSRLAAASLFIYLTQYQVFPPVLAAAGPAAAVAVSVVVGISAAAVWTKLGRAAGQVSTHLARRRAGTPDQRRSKRSSSMTLTQAATKSPMKLSLASSEA